jgi:hypothetical protein
MARAKQKKNGNSKKKPGRPKKLDRKRLAQENGWYSQLKEDEIGRDEGTGEEFPYHHGLARLAALAGKVSERITFCHLDKIVYEDPRYYNLIAQVVVEVIFDDNTTWTGAADAHYANCNEFKAHPTATAETRALGRAYRRALGIRQIAFEEKSDVPEEEMTGEASNQQLSLIRKLCKDIDIELIDVIKKVTTRDDVTSIDHFNKKEAEEALRLLNELKGDKVKKEKKDARKSK